MKRIVFLFFLLPLFLDAQTGLDFGFMIGASAYKGDLSAKESYIEKEAIHSAIGVFGRYSPNPYISFRGGYTYGQITGDDAWSEDPVKQERNLSFQSNIHEFSFTGEFNILGYDPASVGQRFSPYLFGGVAFFSFKPEANYNGRFLELQPLGTEGQGMNGFAEPYRLAQLSIPFGAGVKFALTDRVTVGMEAGFRKTFTDYLDDVSGTYVNYHELRTGNGDLSAALANRTGEYLGTDPVILRTGTQRGNDQADDWYFMGGATISFNIAGTNKGLGRGSRNGFGCPRF